MILLKDIKKTATTLAFSQSDLQCVLGIAIQGLAYDRMRPGRDLSIYHLRIICSLVILSIIVHVFTLALFKHKFKKSRRIKWLRGTVIYVDAVAGIVLCGMVGYAQSMPAALFSRCIFVDHATGSNAADLSADSIMVFASTTLPYFLGLAPFIIWTNWEPSKKPDPAWTTTIIWVYAVFCSAFGVYFVVRTLIKSQAFATTPLEVTMSTPGSEREMTYGQWLGIIVLMGNVLTVTYTFFGMAFALLHVYLKSVIRHLVNFLSFAFALG